MTHKYAETVKRSIDNYERQYMVDFTPKRDALTNYILHRKKGEQPIDSIKKYYGLNNQAWKKQGAERIREELRRQGVKLLKDRILVPTARRNYKILVGTTPQLSGRLSMPLEEIEKDKTLRQDFAQWLADTTTHWEQHASEIEAEVAKALQRLPRPMSYTIELKVTGDKWREALATEIEQECQRQRLEIERERNQRDMYIDQLRQLYTDLDLKPRRIIARLGPTNSGKTHDAMAALANAKSGAYLAPLRLLALEGRDKLNELGVPCDLVTGEEIERDESAQHVACTTEMHDLDRHYEVVVIDEIQLLGNRERGWAWTRALLASHADTIIVTGGQEAAWHIKTIAELGGDHLEVIDHDRKKPLILEEQSSRISDLKQGDAIIAFSRREIIAWKQRLENAGISAAVIYGALNPEVRREQARIYRSGEAQIVVASDAIGMGLNLPIERVIFSTTYKWNGQEERRITASEVKQIAGRAGRGPEAQGRVGYFYERDRQHIHKQLKATVRLAQTIYVAPEWKVLAKRREEGDTQSVRQMLDEIAHNFQSKGRYVYWLSEETRTMLLRAERQGISFKDQYQLIGLPLNADKKQDQSQMDIWFSNHSAGKPSFPPIVAAYQGDIRQAGDDDLVDQEKRARHAGAYLWLARKYPELYPHRDQAIKARSIASANITQILRHGHLKQRTRREWG